MESRLGSGLRRAIDLGSREELSKALAKENIRYLLLSTRDLENPPTFYPYAHSQFLREFATLEYSDPTTRVFHLKQ